MSTGRNEPCPCGSGKKYKRCCLVTGGPDQGKKSKQAAMIGAGIVILALIVGFAVSKEAGGLVAVVGAAAVGVWMWMSAEPPAAGGGSDPSAINFGR